MPAAQVQAAADQMEVVPLPTFVASDPLGQAEAALQRTQVSRHVMRSDAGGSNACLCGTSAWGQSVDPLAHRWAGMGLMPLMVHGSGQTDFACQTG